MIGLLGKKKGMTQIFGPGAERIAVTVLEVLPGTVILKKTKERDGYEALQLGFIGAPKKERLSKPRRGHFEKKQLACFQQLREFRLPDLSPFAVGQVLDVRLFQAGDRVQIQGVTKGRGFQGVIKRHGKHGGPDSHGSDFHRRPGSIGMRTWPGRVLKNTRLPGRMGGEKVTIRNLPVVAVRPEESVLLVAGAVPGHREASVVICHRGKEILERLQTTPEQKQNVEGKDADQRANN